MSTLISGENQRQADCKDGRWTKEEHQKFLMGLEVYGRNWKEISKLVATRSGSQIRSHAQKHFQKLKKTNSDKETISNPQEGSESPEEESTANHSYYMQQIAKLSMEQPQLRFWDFIVGTEPKNPSAGSCVTQQKLRTSFTPYTDPDTKSGQPGTFKPLILTQSH